jgi:hypothetical protein
MGSLIAHSCFFFFFSFFHIFFWSGWDDQTQSAEAFQAHLLVLKPSNMSGHLAVNFHPHVGYSTCLRPIILSVQGVQI